VTAARVAPAALALVAVALAAAWPLAAHEAGVAVATGVPLATAAGALALLRPEYGIALAAALAPLTNLAVGGRRPVEAALPLLAAAVLAHGLLVAPSGRRIPAGLLGAGVFAMVAVAAASALTALDPGAALPKLAVLATGAALFAAVPLTCRRRAQLVVVLGGVVLGLLLAAAHGLLQQATGDFSEAGFIVGGEIVHRIQGSFGHPNQYGGYLAVFVPVAVALAAARALPGPVRALAAAAALAALPALTLSYARGAVVGLALGSLVWLAVMRPRAAVAAAVAIVVALLALAPRALEERLTDDRGSDVALRADLWGAAVDIAADRPLLGAGIANFDVAYERLPSTAASASQRRLLHQRQLLTPPHANNLYLNVLAEQGVLGLAALLALLAGALAVAYRVSRAADRVVRNVGLGLGAAVATFALHSLLEVNVPGELGLSLLALLGVAAVLRDESRERDAAGA
jgi:O-antigen ligase